jgi:hypothetical protein
MDEFCAGVQIILKRIESHPEEFTQEFGPWKRLMDSVLAYKKGGDFDDRYYLKALTDQEIDTLHKAFLPVVRQEFDTWVMKQVLAEPREEEKHWAVGAMAQAKANAQNSAKILQENLFT